ncbi:hypothetical protein [Streptomyces scopuliridis]|uniref:hypothetical protein n=1 Tax=Streptomyces scopuliridis TaxID=452529 RepID=UPI0036A380AB
MSARKNTARKRVVLATAAAALGAGLAVAPATSAATSGMNPHVVPLSGPFREWNTKNHGGDIAGAHAWGNEGPLDSGRVLVDGTLKDTKWGYKGDGKSACLQIHAKYADGGTRDEWVYTGGKLTKHIYYTFASSVRTIWVREGLGKGGHCTKMAQNGVYKIYPQ